MNWIFKDRIVTKIGTIYSHFIGDSKTTDAEAMDRITPVAMALKGQVIEIDGKKVKVVDVEVSQRCNLMEMNYYVNILTDEETSQQSDFNI